MIRNIEGSFSGYAHAKATIQEGYFVSEGYIIGLTDGSGTGNTPHLHYTYKPLGSKKTVDRNKNHIKIHHLI